MSQRRNCIANALELRLFCIKPPMDSMVVKWNGTCGFDVIAAISILDLPSLLSVA